MQKESVISMQKTNPCLININESELFFFNSLKQKGYSLNPQQIEAIRYKSNLLVNSGAGTGKTSVLACKVAYLKEIYNIPSINIFPLTYNKKAALELEERLKLLIGNNVPSVYTIHGLCFKILRSNGYSKYKVLANEKKKEWIIKNILSELKLDNLYQSENICNEISFVKNSCLKFHDKNLCKAAEKYDEYKSSNSLLDFDDILTKTLKLLKNSSLCRALQNQFKYVLVDEAQDLNPIQYSIITKLSSSKNSTCFVGDPRQSIYSFRASDVTILMNLKKAYNNIHTIELSKNYRSTTSIVALANDVINQSNLKFSNSLKSTKVGKSSPKFVRPIDANDEARYIISSIKETLKATKSSYSDFAILYRSSKVARVIFEELICSGIPYIAPGLSTDFYENEITKPVISYLKLSLNQNNADALKNIAKTLYMSKQKLQFILSNTKAMDYKLSLAESLLIIPTLEDYQYDLIEKRLALLQEIKELPPINAIQKIRECFYDKYLKIDNFSLKSEMIKETLGELESAAIGYSTIQEFLSSIDYFNAHVKSTSNASNNCNTISLLSIHSSKGLQFNYVFIIGAIDGIIPHKYSIEPDLSVNNNHLFTGSIEEELRLLYVAITRAREELHISSPMQYNNRPAEVSRFLKSFFYIQNYTKEGD